MIYTRLLCIVICCLGINFIYAQPKAAFTANFTKGCSPLIVQFTDASTGNPTQWKWDLGNGTQSTQQNPSSIYFNPGTYTIKLIAVNSSGLDSVIKTNYITVYENPNIAFTATPTSGCNPLNVQFTDASTAGSGTIAKETWDFGDGQIFSGTNPSHIYTVSDTFSVTLSVLNSYGCKQILQKPALINIAPDVTADFNYNYTNACQPPTNVNFNNLSVSKSPLNYQWFFGDGGSSVQTNPFYTYNKNGNYLVQLVVRSDQGCADTISKSISIGKVIPDFILPTNACVNIPLLFTNASSPSPVSASWTFGDAGTSNRLNPTHTYTTAGTFQIRMTADFGSCNSSIVKNITVLDKPRADFSATGNLSTCALPTAIQFNNNSTGAVSYKWIFGDGNISEDKSPSHIFTKAGFFSVTLIAFNTNGCSDTIVKTNLVKLGPPNIISFDNLPFSGCVPETIKMHAVINSPEPVVKYTWFLGDGKSDNDSTPVHQYTQAGTYTVKLIVTSSGGCSDTFSMPNAVQLGIPPHANFSGNPLDVCGFNSVSFTDLSTGNITLWQWYFGDGGNSTTQNPRHQYTDTGYFTVKLIVSNNGCLDSISFAKYVHVNPPIAKFNTVVNCSAPFIRNFIDKSIGAKTWNWSFGDGATSTLQNPSYTYKTAGKYFVKLTVTNATCTDYITDSVLVVSESPSFTYSPSDTTLCKYDSVHFNATNYNSVYVSSFFWDFGDGTTSGFAPQNNSLSHNYNQAGIYTPILVVKDVVGCKDTISNQKLHFHIYGPTAGFINPAGTCINGSIAFTDQSVSDGTHSITKWIWNYGDGNSQTLFAPPFNHNYDTAGNFTVQLKVFDSYGCMDSVIKNNDVLITKPVADFSVSDSIKCEKTAVNFNNLSSGVSLNCIWDFGNGQLSNDFNPSVNYTTEGAYTIKLAITDKFGCKDSITKPNYITISNPKASFNLTDTFASCPPLLIQPKNTSQNYNSVLWNFGDGNSASFVDPSHYYVDAGTYNLQLIVKGFGQCYDTSTKKVILKGPSGNLQYNTVNRCVPLTVSFSSAAKNASSFTWDFNNGVTQTTTDSSITYVYKSYGFYLPKLVLQDAEGCKVSIVNTDTIQVADVKANAIQTTKINCDSSLITFANTSVAYNDAIKNYAWNFGDSTTSTKSDPAHYYQVPGTYNVSLITTTNAGCTDSITIPVTVQINKSPQIVASIPDSVCVNTAAEFNATNNDTSAVVWQWNFGNGVFNSNRNTAYAYSLNGIYNVIVKAADKYGCKDSAFDKITVLASPNINAGADTAICFGNSVTLQASGGATYEWISFPSLSCINCANPVAKPDFNTTYCVKGNDFFGCSASDSVIVQVNRPFIMSTSASDTLCHGEKVTLTASGANLYQWSPATFLDNPTSAHPVFNALADTSIIYTIIGRDNKNCFADTATVKIKVYPIPQMQVLQNNISLNVGSSVQLTTKNSADVTQWRWSPSTWLNDPTLASPTATPQQSVIYTVVASNAGACVAREQINITILCNNANVFVPNTFSPNNDGMNDKFFPRGKGLFSIKSLMIFNRWGQMIFQKTNFNANNPNDGWDGTYNGKQMPSDVYVYIMDVICQNSTVYSVKGNVTLIR